MENTLPYPLPIFPTPNRGACKPLLIRYPTLLALSMVICATLSGQSPAVKILIQKRDSLYKAGKNAEAIGFAKQVVDSLAIRQDSLYCLALWSLGNCQGKLSYAQSVPIYELCLATYKGIYNRKDIFWVNASNNLGQSLLMANRVAEAEQIIRQNLEDCEKFPGKNHRAYSLSLFTLARILDASAKYEQAADVHQEVLKNCAANYGPASQTYAQALLNAGLNFQYQGNYLAAEQYYLQALELFKQLLPENHPNILSAYSNLVTLYGGDLKNNRQGLKYGRLIVEHLGKTKLPFEYETHFRRNYITSLMIARDFEAAREQVLTIERLIQESGHSRQTIEYLKVYWQLAEIEKNAQRDSLAERYFQAYFRLAEQLKPFAGGDIAVYVSTRCSYGLLLIEQGRYAEASTNLDTVFHWIDSTGYEKKRARCGALKARLMLDFAKGDYFEAVADARLLQTEATQVLIEKYGGVGGTERSGFFHEYIPPGLLFSLLEQTDSRYPEYAGDLLNLRLWSKSLDLRTSVQIRESIVRSGDPEILTKFDEWNVLQRNLLKIAGKTKDTVAEKFELEAKSLSLERELAARSPRFSALSGQFNNDWHTLQQSLKPGEVAVEVVRYFQFEAKKRVDDVPGYAFLILTPEMKQHPVAVFIPDGAQLETGAFANYAAAAADPKAVRAFFQSAYLAYWAPIAAVIGDASTVYFSPDGIYHQINPDVLMTPEGQFLAEKCRIKIVSNLCDIWQREKETGLIPGKAALFGNPKFSLVETKNGEDALNRSSNEVLEDIQSLPDDERGLRLKPLPFSLTEIRNIDSLLRGQGWETAVYSDSTADEATVKNLSGVNIVHLATHGYYVDQRRKEFQIPDYEQFANAAYLRSLLFFAGAQNTIDRKQNPDATEDGILSAYEVLGMNLDGTALVVLSACKTGIGELGNGEGVFGLSRAFRMAGARTVIMSLREVSDKTTQLLMTHFYQNWLGGMAKFEAFRAAQAAVRAQYPAPFYWAGFVLVE